MFKLFFVILLSLFSFQASASVVAKVGPVEITLDDFKKKFDEVKQNINPPTPQQFLEDLVRYEMGVLEAERQKLRELPEVKERFKTELYKFLIEKELGDKVNNIQVTEAEMRRYYQSNPELRSSHILIEFSPNASQEEIKTAEAKANRMLRLIRTSNAPFEEHVRQFSDDEVTKERGGDMGFQSRQTVVPTYYDALAGLKANEVGGPVRTLYGFHIVKLTGRRSYQEANKRQIRAAVFDVKRRAVFDEYFKSLSQRYPVTKREALLRNIQ